MLLGLVFLSYKPAEKSNTVKHSINIEAQKDFMEQRLRHEIQKHQLNIKTLSFVKQAKQKCNLSKTQLANTIYNGTVKKA